MRNTDLFGPAAYEEGTKETLRPGSTSKLVMGSRVRTWGREAGGWSLLSLAILFFPLPVIPSLLLVAGLLILSSNHAWAGKLVRKGQERFPSLFRRKSEPIAAKAV